MRGRPDGQLPLSHVLPVEDRIRPGHPVRDVEKRADRILARLPPAFDRAYRRTGRPSVPPGRLLKALPLMALDSVRSERPLCERGDTDLPFRWFLDLPPGDDASDPTTLTHNRERLRAHGLTRAFFDAVVREGIAAGRCSEHFTVGGTLTESWAALKGSQPVEAAEAAAPDANGFQPRDPDVDVRGQTRSNEAHRSRTDPEARPYRKGVGKEAKRSHIGHAVGENRHGLILAVAVTEATGTAEGRRPWGCSTGGAPSWARGRRRSGRTRGTTGSSGSTWRRGGSSRTSRRSSPRGTRPGSGTSTGGPGSRPATGCGPGRTARGTG